MANKKNKAITNNIPADNSTITAETEITADKESAEYKAAVAIYRFSAIIHRLYGSAEEQTETVSWNTC